MRARETWTPSVHPAPALAAATSAPQLRRRASASRSHSSNSRPALSPPPLRALQEAMRLEAKVEAEFKEFMRTEAAAEAATE